MGSILGIDGEAIGGAYRLLGSSSYSQLSLRDQLTSAQCFDFLLDCASRHPRLYGYGIGYDVCHWVRDLADGELDRLNREGRCYTQQGTRFYRVTYKPQTMFKVDRLRGLPLTAKGREAVASVTVIDLMRWHRKPFADVADEWALGSFTERQAVRAIKEERPTFSDASLPLIERYNRAECEMLAELGEEMEGSLRRLGIPLSYPLTCGGVAGRLAHQHRIQDFHQPAPEEVMPAIQAAFHGGRMQTCRFGRFGASQHYDMRSAYAWALAQLPDMLGEWVPSTAVGSPGGPWGLRRVRWDIPEGDYPVMPFPHRDSKGYIHYPPCGAGWQWRPLVEAALPHYPKGSIQVLEGWDYYPLESKLRPFWYMEDLYGARMSLKRGGDPCAGLIKLIMVATWGRLCSSGRHRRNDNGGKGSPTRNLVDWAGMTTALIQARILEAIMVNPAGFIACCVDGFWCDGGEGPEVKEGLGNWSQEQASELFLVAQNCYWKSDGCDWTAVTGGIADGGGVLEAALAEWERRGWRGVIEVPERHCHGLKLCAYEGNGYDRLGTFDEGTMPVRLNPGFGRSGHICPTNLSGSRRWEKWLPYWPPVAHADTESAPFVPRAERVMPEETLREARQEVGE